jgi:hypothetical protein
MRTSAQARSGFIWLPGSRSLHPHNFQLSFRRDSVIVSKISMNTETWITPDFEEIAACMECTAYSETLD